MLEKIERVDADFVDKINQLIDAVNSLRDDCNLLMGYIAPEDGGKPTVVKNANIDENVHDVDELERAEKWVGKLCWFSQIYGCNQHIAILKRISESGLYVTDDGELHYAYCKPVKPDDPIIYKGE